MLLGYIILSVLKINLGQSNFPLRLRKAKVEMHCTQEIIINFQKMKLTSPGLNHSKSTAPCPALWLAAGAGLNQTLSGVPSPWLRLSNGSMPCHDLRGQVSTKCPPGAYGARQSDTIVVSGYREGRWEREREVEWFEGKGERQI